MAANRRIMESVAGISLVPTMCIDGILRGKLKINNGFGWSVLVSNRRGEEVYSVSLYHEDEDGKGALDCESVVAVALEAMMRNPDKRTVSEIVKAVRSLDHKGRIMYKENEWRWDKYRQIFMDESAIAIGSTSSEACDSVVSAMRGMGISKKLSKFVTNFDSPRPFEPVTKDAIASESAFRAREAASMHSKMTGKEMYLVTGIGVATGLHKQSNEHTSASTDEKVASWGFSVAVALVVPGIEKPFICVSDLCDLPSELDIVAESYSNLCKGDPRTTFSSIVSKTYGSHEYDWHCTVDEDQDETIDDIIRDSVDSLLDDAMTMPKK